MNGDSATVRTEGAEIRALHAPARYLLVLYQGEKTRVLELQEGQLVSIGRGPEVELVIDDSRASRKHAQISREQGGLYLEDLGSTNGTRLNGVPVLGKQRLGPGDEVTIGSAALVVTALTLAVGPFRVLTDGEFEERLEAELERARRYHRQLSLMMIRFAGPVAEIRRQLESIASVLRRMDSLASYGPRDFVVLLPEADQAAARAVGERLLPGAESSAPARTSAAVASFPQDAVTAGRLIGVARARLRGESVAPATESAGDKTGGHRKLVLKSRAMVQCMGLARRVGALSSTVLVLGETGSGKQVVAEEIHRSSPRAGRPLVHINCAALPATLIESQLFGHERGAFTGADRLHVGLVEAAGGGTLFLDEIGELPAESQPKLLHLLESQTFTRVGGVRPIQGDVRIIAATNRDLETEVQNGHFREDLYFRLSGMLLHVPPLRERSEDILPLAELFIGEFAAAMRQEPPALTAAARDRIQGYEWPGNVRQLRNAMERALVLAEGQVIDLIHLPGRITMASVEEKIAADPLAQTLAKVEAQAIEAALRECGGNQSRAARQLGITRRALIYRMGKLGLR